MDGIIDIIILILVGVVPAIFKAVGKKLEKSGKAEDAGGPALEGWLLERMEPEGPHYEAVAEEAVPVIKPQKRAEAVNTTDRKAPMLVEDEPEKKGEKIDPKKLVIYSEIMKPKY